MRNVTYKSDDLVPYTKEIGSCPKCEGEYVKRIYYPTSEPVTCFWPYVDHEFFKLTCQSCHFEWGQRVRYIAGEHGGE